MVRTISSSSIACDGLFYGVPVTPASPFDDAAAVNSVQVLGTQVEGVVTLATDTTTITLTELYENIPEEDTMDLTLKIMNGYNNLAPTEIYEETKSVDFTPSCQSYLEGQTIADIILLVDAGER